MNRHDLEVALADELRALLWEVRAVDTDETALAGMLADVRSARERIGSTPRSWWYDTLDENGRSDTKAASFNRYSLYRGTANALAPALSVREVALAGGQAAIEGRVRCNGLYEGPPRGVHGGYVAGLFDDVLGQTIPLVPGPTAVTGTLEVKYRKVTPLDTELVFLAWVHHASGRRIHAKATCHAGEVLTAEAEALFVRVDMQALAAGRADYRPKHL